MDSGGEKVRAASFLAYAWVCRVLNCRGLTLGTVLPRQMWKLWNAFKEAVRLRDIVSFELFACPQEWVEQGEKICGGIKEPSKGKGWF